MTELAAIGCCCDSAPGVCNCGICPSSYLVEAAVSVKYFGVTFWAPGMACPNPSWAWNAEDELAGGGPGCVYQAATPEGSFSYQAASSSCGFGQAVNYNGSQTVAPYFLRLECSLKSLLPSQVQPFIGTPSAWRMIITGIAGDLVAGIDLVQYQAVAYYDRPEVCWVQAPPKCIEVKVSSGLAPLGPFVAQSAFIAGSVGSAQFVGAPSVTAMVEQWDVSIT